MSIWGSGGGGALQNEWFWKAKNQNLVGNTGKKWGGRDLSKIVSFEEAVDASDAIKRGLS